MRRGALAPIVIFLAAASGCSSSDDVANFEALNAEAAVNADPTPSVDDTLEWGNEFGCPQAGCDQERGPGVDQTPNNEAEN